MGSQKIGLGASQIGSVGASDGINVIEYGNPANHTTVFELDVVNAVTLADGANIADGIALYTLPDGYCSINEIFVSISLLAADTLLQAGVTDIGIGQAIGTGAQALLSGVANSETVVAGITGTADGTEDHILGDVTPLEVLTGATHDLFLNVGFALTASTGTDYSADFGGSIVMNWSVNS